MATERLRYKHKSSTGIFTNSQAYLRDISRNNFLKQATNNQALRIEGGKERILKVKPKGGEWGNEFHRLFALSSYKHVYFMLVLFS